MNNIENIRAGLLAFISTDKFVEYQHLQPAVENSTEETKQFVNNEMNTCCAELLQLLEQSNSNEPGLRNIVRKFLEKFEYSVLDTEDKEFCYELCFKVGDILGIDIEDKTISIEQKLRQELEEMAKKVGLNLDDFLPSNSFKSES